MNISNSLLFFVCSVGVFNGFLVSLYFLFFSKQKRVQNFLFGLLVFMLSARIAKSVYIIFTESSEINFLYSQIGLSACFLIGASLYFYLKSSVENTKEFPLSWKIHLSVLLLIIVAGGVIKPYDSNKQFWYDYSINIIYTVWGIYILFSGVILKHIGFKLFDKTKSCSTAELWLVAVFIGNALIYIAYLVGYFYVYLVGTITFSVVFYGLLFFFLFKKNRETIFQDIPQKYNAKKITSSEADILLVQLNEIMIGEELYKNADVKLQSIAKKINVSSHKLSQLLNDNLGKSFASYINDFRIEEAKRLIQNNTQFTLEAIGFEAGFSSKSSFYATFKKVVGMTPSAYQKQFK